MKLAVLDRAGNLFLVCSLANLIVVERAHVAGVRLGLTDPMPGPACRSR
ncbi:MAG TPA: hypothetical protein VJ890_21820 [Vineibacter sp.]|nr:hypothetical protein [Vineibacter sp.]